MIAELSAYRRRAAWLLPLTLIGLGAAGKANALAVTCERNVTANIVALDQPVLFNRLGASNVNAMMYALERDVINKTSGLTLNNGGVKQAGNVALRPDKRPRPLVLRVRTGDCLTVNLTNLLAANANPNNVMPPDFNVFIDEQVADRHVSLHVAGMQYLDGPGVSDGAYVGTNADSTVPQGGSKTQRLYAEKEGVFVARGMATTFGSDANQGNSSNLLFGEVIVEPAGAQIYRSTITEEEMRLITVRTIASTGQPVINYQLRYPVAEPWISEGKADLPVLNMMNPPGPNARNVEIVHTAIDGVIAGPNDDGSFPPSTYPLESVGKRNPSVPNRLEPFRDFASVFHDESAAAQAFPGFYVADPVFNYVLAGVKDAFMINYGSGGIGSEIIANRLKVGPMHDCLDCAFEEFFLTSYTVGDPAQLVDVTANIGLEALLPGQAPPAGTTGPKATLVPYPDDPGNVHHSYTGDFVKFRNTHVGKEQHVFHLHNHQWLYNPNDDNSNYMDAQGIGPGAGYTYEINFGGSGNRNKSAGDAIFHCHFYPHFAQGMWYLWRHHDVLETGTELAVSQTADGFHDTPFALVDGTPAPGARALPDGEVVAGAPIPAIVPLPGKAMAPLPGQVEVVPNPLLTTASDFHPTAPGALVPVGSLAKVVDRTKNPGYPFWVAGIEDTVGQRPPTPPLDMATAADVAAAQAAAPVLFADLVAAQAGGWDGGLPRAALQGYAAGGVSLDVTSRLDFSKVVEEAQAVFYPETGTDLERVAMAFHAERTHPSFRVNVRGAGRVAAADFVTNGQKPAIGAPYHEPCIDDQGDRLGSGVIGDFFGGTSLTDMSVTGSSPYNADTPRVYKGANIQFDVVLNKAGYHYPQQRIIALWRDARPVINKQQPPEPLVMRLNTFDCAVYQHANLVPANYELDDYQVRTPTDIIGQHIHLPKWDLTTADGAANGWNYEDGTLSPGAVVERIHALNGFLAADPAHTHFEKVGADLVPVTPTLTEQPHPFFGTGPGGDWLGARTTLQRWFADPVVNTENEDRGLGIIFTHDHYGPSTHQQVGLYATVLSEPAGSTWVHNETGQPLGTRDDGGPTSWQAVILPPASSTVNPGGLEPFREFYFEYSDFQHAYEPGVYVGANQRGRAIANTGPGQPMQTRDLGHPDFALGANQRRLNAFRFAINPPGREQVTPVFPDLVLEVVGGILPGCPQRPCPTAIDVQDPGMFAVNYRNEPVGLRIFDPNRLDCPDGKPGCQTIGAPGDAGLALESREDRRFTQLRATFGTDFGLNGRGVLNAQPVLGDQINGTDFPGPINAGGVKPGDPFTPMMRAYAGDLVRVKMQAGGDEEEHNATIHGLKWLQAGSGHGQAPNSGWRNGQAGGISEQFTLATPVVPLNGNIGRVQDYAYAMDASHDGWWSGMWGILRAYENRNQATDPANFGGPLFELPNNRPRNAGNVLVTNGPFVGACPAETVTLPDGTTADVPLNLREYDVTAVFANQVLPNPGFPILDVCRPNANNPECAGAGHAGGRPNSNGGTLVYNARDNLVGGQTIIDPVDGNITLPTHQGPLHDPTALLYVHTSDVVLDPITGDPIGLKPNTPIEPLVLRAAAGECIKVTLRNGLPGLMRDLPTYASILGAVKRDKLGAEGSTTFQTNLFTPSSIVGLHPQLVAYDVSQGDGTVVGDNRTVRETVNTRTDTPLEVYWYAGDLKATRTGNGRFDLAATPVEFGAINLQPADKIKQGMKSLVGQLVIEPLGATWSEDGVLEDTTVAVSDPARYSYAAGATRAQASVVAAGGAFRDFSTVWSKGLSQHYRDGEPVEHMNGEGVGIPEDSQESSGMAINYGVEPMWFRHGILPNAPFGNAGAGPGTYGGIVNQFESFSNGLVGADPETPVLLANAGEPFRMRVTNPYGTSRGTTFALHGHVWQRDPYVCAGSKDGLAGRCATGAVGSEAIGVNPLGFAQGGQESITPATHFDIVPTRTGDAGDYLFRDVASFGSTSGLWGILRVQ